jgi:DDE superfamily endonuclease
VSAGAQTPPVQSAAAGALPVVRHEVVDPADPAQVAWLAGLLGRGRADLYAQDEADLALLPTLTRTWMPRGEQLQVPAPGTNAKRSVSAAADLAAGALLWRTDDTRCADQFCALGDACAARSAARGRLAALLVDNAQAHRVGKTGIVRRWLSARAGRVVLVFLPPYSPDLQPAERLWRQWRPNVTHNHTRATLADLEADSDQWLRRHAAQPLAVLRALGPPFTQPLRQAA